MCSRRRRKVIASYELGQRRCPICGVQLVYNQDQPNTASFEHLVPKSAKGTEIPINGLVVCKRCNHKRGNMCWEKWLNRTGAPKKEYLLAKYYAAIVFYVNKGHKININRKKINQAIAAMSES